MPDEMDLSPKSESDGVDGQFTLAPTSAAQIQLMPFVQHTCNPGIFKRQQQAPIAKVAGIALRFCPTIILGLLLPRLAARFNRVLNEI